jgi:acetyltransferase
MVAAGVEKPVAIVSMISYMFTEHTRAFRGELKHLPVLQEVDKALKAVGRAGRYGELRELGRQARETDAAPAAAADLSPILRRAKRSGDGRALLDEADSKELLRAYGIASPREIVASGIEDATRAAREIGFPVVLKVLAAEVAHKSDIGGVIVGIKDEEELRAAYVRMAHNLAKARPGMALDKVLVAQQVAGGVELVLGVQRDPEIGPVVMFGTGGVLLELLKDVRFGAVPLPSWQAGEMIERTSAGRLLKGYRGAPPSDQAAVLAALLALGRLAHDLGERIQSIDINPLVPLPAGKGCLALDALVVLRE